MQQDTLFPLEKRLEVVFTGKKFVLPTGLQDTIDAYWNGLIADGNGYTRGEVFTISDIEETEDVTTVIVELSDYAHYLYTRRVGLPGEYACKNLHTSCLFETSDGMLVFGRMGKQTSVPGNIQCVGGGLDKDDVRGVVIDLEHNIRKELQEEVGIDVGDSVSDFGVGYLRYDSRVHSIAAIFILKLSVSSRELSDHYGEFEAKLKDDGEQPEFESLIYVSKDKMEIDALYAKEGRHFDHYLMPLLEVVVSNPI
ncbi:MAG: hypothetical protein WCJ25_02815 [Candidatus Moraniibacteriota bacterium]